MANAEPKAPAARLFSFTAVVVLLFACRGAIGDLVLAALDRFHLDGRSLLDLATKRNMILLCHAILLVILRDAGVLGGPARRRASTTASVTAAVVATASQEEAVCPAPAPAPARPGATRAVVWRWPRSSAKDAGVDDSGRRLVRRRQPRRSHQQLPAATAIPFPCAAPALMTLQPEQAADQQPSLVNREIVLVEKAPTTSYLIGDKHDPAAEGVELEQASGASATDAAERDLDRRIIIADDEMDVNAAAEEEEAPEPERLADDRRFDEFIAKQRSKMWQEESLQLVIRSSSGFQQAAIPAC
ncbi:unnamed protein product [Urochloa humidicola]